MHVAITYANCIVNTVKAFKQLLKCIRLKQKKNNQENNIFIFIKEFYPSAYWFE